MPDASLDRTELELPEADITYFPNFLDRKTADDYFHYLLAEVPWQQDSIRLFGKTHKQPRLTALYGDHGKTYSYSGITMHPYSFPQSLLQLKIQVEAFTREEFTTCLLNRYRNGNDSNGWHADDEKELGRNPVIASVSLGAVRTFRLKHRREKNLKHKIDLEHGSLLLMKGATQHHWLHQLPKTRRQVGERVNLTFRYIP
jgi:alkylated DNA repair dioxygenase AlkB